MTSTLDSRQLLAFAHLARCGSFTQTAKNLHLTQSAISHTIKALEQDVGVSLFERVGKRAFLTEAGELLRPAAEKILREMHDTRAVLEQAGSWGRGRLRVGASVTACQHLLPTVLREFRQSFPECSLRLEPGDGPRMIELLNSNQIDLALMLEPARESGLEFRALFTDELRILVSPMHGWARSGRVGAEAIARETLIVYNKGSFTDSLLSEHFRRYGVEWGRSMELGSMEAIKELAKVGVGAGVLARWVARRELDEGSLVSLALPGGKLKRTWGVGHLRGRRLSLAEETFSGLCEAVAQSLEVG
ncbi:MAG: LysR family transcriptional regulator [Opitutaceae bacterium]|jgi:DNA-binding transcriptional LysR family regulator|nr:LysR family transcriptional regulator [Opitutaceae bacterium]